MKEYVMISMGRRHKNVWGEKFCEPEGSRSSHHRFFNEIGKWRGGGFKGEVNIMATMICESCQSTFEGRPNRKYCSIDCRRKAEMVQREIKKEERHKAWLASTTEEERNPWGIPLPTDWGNLPGEELMAEKPPVKGSKRRNYR